MHHLTLYALELARNRDLERELKLHRLMAEGAPEDTGRPSRVRRSTAVVLAAVSRTTASAVRRLDDCVADDLGRSLAPTE